MIRSILITVLLGGFFYVNGQDAMFTQFSNNENLINPGLLATQNSPLELSVTFREQAGAVSEGLPLTTFQAMANFSRSSFKEDRVTYGISIFSDKGGIGHLGSNMFHGQFAYMKKLTGSYSKIGTHYLSIGTSVGLGQRSLSGSRYWFGRQFDTGSYMVDSSRDSGESTLITDGNGQSGLITDINVGVSWYGSLSESLAIQAGGSVFHMDRSNISILQGGVERNRMRYNAHFQVAKDLYDNLSLKPQVLFIKQGPAYQFLVGSEVQIDNLDDNEFIFNFGVFSRVVNSVRSSAFESLVLTLNTTYNGVRFGFAYDFTLSGMSSYNNGRGAWEVNLGYAIQNKNKSGYYRQKERFRL